MLSAKRGGKVVETCTRYQCLERKTLSSPCTQEKTPTTQGKTPTPHTPQDINAHVSTQERPTENVKQLCSCVNGPGKSLWSAGTRSGFYSKERRNGAKGRRKRQKLSKSSVDAYLFPFLSFFLSFLLSFLLSFFLCLFLGWRTPNLITAQ